MGRGEPPDFSYDGGVEIVLGSASPRRAEILRAAGIPFRVQRADVDERRLDGEDAKSYVRRLARLKAEAVQGPGLILAADTTVQVDGHILEKPTGPEDAARMLRLLSGRAHEVLTGVCLRAGRQTVVEHETTRVYFRALSEQDIEAYAGSGEPLDKAGAYAIQGLASRFIYRIEGCYFNVVGLPISLVWQLLQPYYSLAAV